MTANEFCKKYATLGLMLPLANDTEEMCDEWDSKFAEKDVNWLTFVATKIDPDIKNKLLEVVENMGNPFLKKLDDEREDDSGVAKAGDLEDDIEGPTKATPPEEELSNIWASISNSFTNLKEEELSNMWASLSNSSTNLEDEGDAKDESAAEGDAENEKEEDEIDLEEDTTDTCKVTISILEDTPEAEVSLLVAADAKGLSINRSTNTYIVVKHYRQSLFFETPKSEVEAFLSTLKEIFSCKYLTGRMVVLYKIMGIKGNNNTILQTKLDKLTRLATLLQCIEDHNEYIIRFLIAINMPSMLHYDATDSCPEITLSDFNISLTKIFSLSTGNTGAYFKSPAYIKLFKGFQDIINSDKPMIDAIVDVINDNISVKSNSSKEAVCKALASNNSLFYSYYTICWYQRQYNWKSKTVILLFKYSVQKQHEYTTYSSTKLKFDR